MMKKTIGILAHVDAGKTTFSEQILFHTNSIRSRGRVDHQDAFLDSHPIERERGITVFSGCGEFSIGDSQYTLLDTPGHVDFSAEMERAVQVMDYGILLVSCVEGIQGHTRTLWKLLEDYQVPVFLFCNKIDREGAQPQKLLQELQRVFSPDIVDFSEFSSDGAKPQLAEELASRDEVLLETYLEQGYEPSLFLEKTRSLIRQRKLFPCLFGSALLDQGVQEFLQLLDTLSQTDYEEKESQPFSARVYQVRHDAQGNRLASCKILTGSISVREAVECPSPEGRTLEKINEIRRYHGEKHRPVSQAKAGDIVAFTGLSQVRPGDGLGALQEQANWETVPTLVTRLIFDPAVQPRTVLAKFRMLEDEDPLLQVEWNEALQEIRLHVMGKIQLEVLQQVAKQRFGLEISYGSCQVAYQETIAEPVKGYGHFEPLRHYAEVHLLLEPLPRGSGIRFESRCPTDLLASNYQNLIRTHVLEKKHRGVLLGAPLTDVRISLLSGRAHEKHTEGGDFREATYRAIRQGLEKAQTVILEPYYSFSIEVAPSEIGRVLSDLQKMQAEFDTPLTIDDRTFLSGRGPVLELQDYPAQLTSFTRGRGSISLRFDGYEPCHNPQQAVQQIGYDKQRDMENTSDSVFCSHGSGFVVDWQQAESYMHLPL